MNLKACRQREDSSLSQTRTYHAMMHTGYWEHFTSCHNSFVNYSDFLTWSHDTEGDGITKYDRKSFDLFSLNPGCPSPPAGNWWMAKVPVIPKAKVQGATFISGIRRVSTNSTLHLLILILIEGSCRLSLVVLLTRYKMTAMLSWNSPWRAKGTHFNWEDFTPDFQYWLRKPSLFLTIWFSSFEPPL